MLVATKPDLTGKLQIKIEDPAKTVYQDIGDIALWKHPDSKYLLRGYVAINGTKYLVSLTDAER